MLKYLVLLVALSLATGNDLAAENCDNFLSCMNIDLYNNLTQIGHQDVYKISDRLMLEKYSSGNESDLVSRRQLAKKNAISTYTLMKKIMGLFETHALRYKLTRGLDLAVFKDTVDGVAKISVGLVTDQPARDGRTFGVAVFRKRMMYILLAMTFKLGIMTSLLATILVLVLKGLKIGVLLLMLTFGSVFAKWKTHNGHHQEEKGIHVHVHNDPHQQAYSAWAPEVPNHGYHTYQRRNNGQVYSVRDDVNIGYPAVFRPPIASYVQKSGYIPTAGQRVHLAGLGLHSQTYQDEDVDRSSLEDYGVGVRGRYDVERQPEFAQVYMRRSGLGDEQGDEVDS